MTDGVTMASTFGGMLRVSIEGLGTFEVDPAESDYPLVGYAAFAYAVLAKRIIGTSAEDWELVDFNPKARTLKVRYRPTTGWTQPAPVLSR